MNKSNSKNNKYKNNNNNNKHNKNYFFQKIFKKLNKIKCKILYKSRRYSLKIVIRKIINLKFLKHHKIINLKLINQ